MDWIEKALGTGFGQVVALFLAPALVVGVWWWAWQVFGLLVSVTTWQWHIAIDCLPWVLLPFVVVGTLELVVKLARNVWNRRTNRCV